MIRVKDDSVKIAHLNPGMLLGLIVADQVYTEYGYECVVTSANDARHSQTSLHYANDALDMRTSEMSETHKPAIEAEISERLGIDFDVVLESDHLHIEKQPRRR